MRMSTKGRIAVNALIDLALHAPAGPVTLSSICQRRRISLSYLEQLFGRLRREGLVESTRGPGGGYTLARKPAEITVAQVVLAVDEPGEDPAPGDRSSGLSLDLWQRLHAAMLQHMETITLASLVEDLLDKGVVVEARPMRLAIPAPRVLEPVRTRAPNSVFALGRSIAA